MIEVETINLVWVEASNNYSSDYGSYQALIVSPKTQGYVGLDAIWLWSVSLPDQTLAGGFCLTVDDGKSRATKAMSLVVALDNIGSSNGNELLASLVSS